ncbi:MAG: YrvL family regulatory protein [Culicoidibacterales bacterium]
MINKLKKIIEPIIGYGLVSFVLIVVISVIAILGGGIMKLFGFEYTSIKSIIIFFIIVAIVGFPIEIFASAFPKALLSLDKITLKFAKILFVTLDTLSTMFTLALVDYFMGSVSASDISIFAISFIIALLSLNDLNE